MSKYSGVDTMAIGEFVNSSLIELDSHNFDNIKSDLSSGIFDVPVKQNILNLFSQINSSQEINGSIINLKGDLNKLKNAIDLINQIKSYDSQLVTIYNAVEGINNRLREISSSTNDLEKGELNRQLGLYQGQINGINDAIGRLEGQIDVLLS